MITNREREFLIGLRELTIRTGVKICGCGCCDSPWLEEIKVEGLDPNSGYASDGGAWVKWVSPEDKFGWSAYKDEAER